MRMLSGRRHWLMVGLALLVSADGFTTRRGLAQVPTKPAAAAKKKQSDRGYSDQAGLPGYGVAYGATYGPQGMPQGMPPGMPPGMPQGMPPGMPPGMPGGAMFAGGMGPDAPMSMSFPGPAPGEVIYAGAFNRSACDGGGGCDCGACGGGGGLLGGVGLFGGGGLLGNGGGNGGAGAGAGRGGSGSGGLLGGGRNGNGGGGLLGGGRNGNGGGGLLGGGGGLLNGGGPMGGGCPHCRGAGCFACGASGCLFPCQLLNLLGPLAPYSEGAGSQRWFDIYAGTIGLRRTGGFGPFATAGAMGLPAKTNLVSTRGTAPGGTPILLSNQLDLDRMRYGLEIMANLQTGVGTNIEGRYFGLNNWTESISAFSTNFPAGPPNLFSVFSVYGTSPPASAGPPPSAGGFDDTDRSFIHTLNYNSEIHNGEVNLRHRFLTPLPAVQGSVLAGVRYFDLDEVFSFQATGSRNNTFTANQLRFFNYETSTRNQLTGFQVGGDVWATVCPGLSFGGELKGGIFGNHAEVYSVATSNSIAGANEFLQDGKTAFLTESTISMLYRLTYSISLKTSYNLMYVDNVAIAVENFNTRDFSNALGGGAFTGARFPFIDVDGEIFYQGWSIGGEYMW